MINSVTWKIAKNKKSFTDIRKIIVSSKNLNKNRLVCSLLDNGWMVLKLEVKCKGENTYYVYWLGKPIAV